MIRSFRTLAALVIATLMTVTPGLAETTKGEDASPYPDMRSEATEMGYALVQDDSGLAVLHNGDVVWSIESWMLSFDEPRDLTLDGMPNLLIHTARSRSFREITLLELGSDGVQVLWSVDGHVLDIRLFEAELIRRMSAGESLATPPPGGSVLPLDTLQHILPQRD